MPAPQKPPGDDVPHIRRARGELLWHAAKDPIFLLSGARRLRYANPAWERLTGIAFAEARGHVSRRRAAAADVEPVDRLLGVLAPPPEAHKGQTCQVRRRAPGQQLTWWEIDFFPWLDAQGAAGILGKIRVIEERGPAHAALPEKLVQLRGRVNQPYRLESWQSEAPAMHRLVAQMRLAAQTRVPILISGPKGSGKNWAARTLHQISEVREGFFATLNPRLPAAILADLLASGRSSQIATIYLADVERLPGDLQALVLERLDNESFDAGPRLLAGTSASLEEAVRARRFLPELHARLSTMTLQVPALADRLQDLPTLVKSMLPRAGEAAERPIHGLSPAAGEVLLRHAWPGNLRELYDVLVQACRRARTDPIDVDDLPFYLRGSAPAPTNPLPLDETLAKVERRLIELALRLSQGNKSGAAEWLAIWRPRLIRRMEQLGMNPKENDPA